MPDDFLQKLSRLGDRTDAIAEAVLEAGAEVVVGRVRRNLQSAIGSNPAPLTFLLRKNVRIESRSTGELLASLGVSPVKVNREGGHDIKVGFNEPRIDGNVNAKIANILEHGTSAQPARPFLKPARTASRKQATETMKAKLEEEIGKL